MEISDFSLDGMEVMGTCCSAYDGDSVKCIFEFNGKKYRWNCRLDGIDTPEIRSKNVLEKKAALEARDFLREKILDKDIKIKCGKFDKYGRVLVNIWKDKECINELMVNNGYAHKYDGGKKQLWTFTK